MKFPLAFGEAYQVTKGLWPVESLRNTVSEMSPRWGWWQIGEGNSEPGALWSEIEMAIGVRHAVIARNYGGKLKLPRSSGTPIVGTRDTVPGSVLFIRNEPMAGLRWQAPCHCVTGIETLALSSLLSLYLHLSGSVSPFPAGWSRFCPRDYATARDYPPGHPSRLPYSLYRDDQKGYSIHKDR